MKALMVEYEVKPEFLEPVKEAIWAFVRDVHHFDDGILFYEAFQKSNAKFVHFMGFVDENAENNHKNASHTKHFVEVLYPKCVSEPVFTDLKKVEPE